MDLSWINDFSFFYSCLNSILWQNYKIKIWEKCKASTKCLFPSKNNIKRPQAIIGAKTCHELNNQTTLISGENGEHLSFSSCSAFAKWQKLVRTWAYRSATFKWKSKLRFWKATKTGTSVLFFCCRVFGLIGFTRTFFSTWNFLQKGKCKTTQLFSDFAIDQNILLFYTKTLFMKTGSGIMLLQFRCIYCVIVCIYRNRISRS